MEVKREAACRPADESSRKGETMEWWFVQGRFEGEGIGKREFMVSLFRHALEWGGLSAGNTFSLVVAVLDPATGAHRTLSRIEPATAAFLVKAAKLSPPAGLDPLAMTAVIAEIEQYGPAKQIAIASSAPRVGARPLRVEWMDFELRQEPDGFVLKFDEPGTGVPVALRLTPQRPRVELPGVEVPGGGAMDYMSYTRMGLGGEAGGAAVSGQAWFDHQWGSWGWFIGGSKQEHIFGWDWMGVQLDDGRDWMIIVHRDQRGSKTLCQYAVEVAPDGSHRVHRDARLEPLSWWTSPSTGARYPVRWRIAVPGAGLELDFEPYAEDQEIPLLPPIRAVWEGAGRVSGRSGGTAVVGAARLELHGYAYVLDLDDFLDGVIRRIHGHIQGFLPREFDRATLDDWAGTRRGAYDPAAQTAMVARPLWDLIGRGGKHWRPIFGILLLDAMGVPPAPYERLITITTELLHDAALIIDDIQDNALTRRGAECIHRRYGTDVAIHAANTAYFMPLMLLREYPGLTDAQKLDLYKALSRLFVGAHFGQGQDIYWSKTMTPGRLRELVSGDMADTLHLLYTQKTASVVEAAAEGAAIIAGAHDALRSACADFGRTLGVAFQIMNDLVDFSDGRLGAGCGGCDLREGKVTYLVLRALQRLPARHKARLEAILCSPELRADDAAIAEGVDLVRRSGAVAECKKDAARMVEEEWARLSEHLPPSEAKQMLRVLWTFLLDAADNDRFTQYAPGN